MPRATVPFVGSTLAALATAAGLLTPTVVAAEPTPATTVESRLDWWRNGKLGMFIHWGAYSQAGGEWNGETNHAEWLQLTAKIPLTEYAAFAKDFNPVKYDADAWARLARESGAKYLVITSKHHDGFAMYDSASSDYNIVDASAFGRDPLKELAEACEREGIKFCVYYSLGRDWHDPDVPTGPLNSPYKEGKRYYTGWRSNLLDYPNEDAKDFSKYFERKVKPQVRELLTTLGPIGVLWFDTPERISPEQSAELLALCRELQPDCIVNQRVGNGLGDYGTPEQTIPREASSEPWETCMTLNGHWGYNRADNKWKSTETLVRNLIDIVSKGGNYLLNVGPTGEGEIPQPSVDRFLEMGEWLRTNGEAIYGCGPTPFGAELGQYDATKKDKRGEPSFTRTWQWRATTGEDKLYLHVFNGWGDVLQLPAVEQRVAKAYRLSDPSRAPIAFEQTTDGVAITLPADPSEKFASVFCLELE